MRFRTSFVLVVAIILVFSTCHIAWAVELSGFFIDPYGDPIDSITVPASEPVALNFAVVSPTFQEAAGYNLQFLPPAAELLDWQDAHGGMVMVNTVNWGITCINPSSPMQLMPAPTIIGTMIFCPSEPTTLFGDSSQSILMTSSGSCPINILPLEISFGTTPPPPPATPDPPPAPASYQMGTIANGNFEASGGSLDGWSVSAYDESSVQATTLTSDHSDTVAKLHSEGHWEPGPFIEPEYWGGSCSMSQEIYVPVDADEITFTYCTREQILLSDGSTSAGVWLGNNGNDRQEVNHSEVWTTYTLPVSEEMRGHRQRLRFDASDSGCSYTGDDSEHNSLDFFVDYVGINGTTVLQTATWSAAGGGAWNNSGNWNPTAVPDNSVAHAYDVVVPETASGGDITIAAARTVQSLDYSRTSGALVINPGGSLSVKDFMTVRGGTIDIHPTGSSTGGTALTVDGTLDIEASSTGQASSLSIQDARVTAKDVVIDGSGTTVSVSRSAGFAGQPCLEGTNSVSLSRFGGSHLQLNPGTAVVTPYLSIGPDCSLTVENATISEGSSGGSSSTSNSGTTTFRGQCLVDQNHFYNRGDLVFEDSDTTFTGWLSHSHSSESMSLIRSVVTVEGSFSTSSSTDGLLIDADSVLRVHEDFNNYGSNASQFNIEAGTLLFTGEESSDLYVQGLNQGPFTFGFDENFGLGNLVVEQGTVVLQESSTGHAQYLRNLTIAAGTTLDLNGIPLYCLGTLTNEGQVIGGEIRQAYTQSVDLPAPSVTSYTISGIANDESGSSIDSPFNLSGWRTPEEGWFEEIEDAYARVEGSVTHEENHCLLSLEIQGTAGRAFDGWFYEESIPADASVEIEAMLEVEANDTYADGAEVELLILTALSGYTDPDDWGVDVYRGDELIASCSAGTTELTLDATIGETLRFEAWLSGSANEVYQGFDSALDVRIYTLTAVPEPGSVILLLLAVLSVAACPRRRAGRPKD